MTDVKRRQQYGIDIAKPEAPRAAVPALKDEKDAAAATPLVGEALVKAAQNLMENGA